MPPPQLAVLPEMVLFSMVRVPYNYDMPPPYELAVLPEMVLFLMRECAISY